MQKKNKLMLAAAVGMVAVVVATTAVRCTIAHTASEDEAGRPAAEAALEEPAADGGEGATTEAGEADEAGETLARLRGGSWVAADGSGKTLAFRDGAFVESDGASASLTAFGVEGAGSSEGQRWLDVRMLRSGDAGAASATLILEEGEAGASVASDGFLLSDRYVEAPAAAGGVEVTGLADSYLALVGGDGDGLERAIGEWARSNAPTAGEASFDGEVFLDTAAGRVSATFHLDDAASTIIAVSYEGGEFSVAG